MKEAVQSAEERLGERLNSHDELLMKTIREQQETKKLLAAAKEETLVEILVKNLFLFKSTN